MNKLDGMCGEAFNVLFYGKKVEGFTEGKSFNGLDLVVFKYTAKEGITRVFRLIKQNEYKNSFCAELARNGWKIAWLFDEKGYVYREGQSIVMYQLGDSIMVGNSASLKRDTRS